MVYSSYLNKRLTIFTELFSCDGLVKILPALVDDCMIFKYSWGNARVCVCVCLWGRRREVELRTARFLVQEQIKKHKLHPY